MFSKSISLYLFLLQACIKDAIASRFDIIMQQLQDLVKDGGENSFKSSIAFFTDDDIACSTCEICEGSHLMSIFDSTNVAFCIDCMSTDNVCRKVKVTATFKKPWAMTFFSVESSSTYSSTE